MLEHMIGVIGVILAVLGLFGLLTSQVDHDVLAWACLIGGVVLIALTVRPLARRYR